MEGNGIQRGKRVRSLRLVAIICCFVLAGLTLPARGQSFHDLKPMLGAAKSEKILVVHIALGECENCVQGFKQAVECVKNQLPLLKLEVVAGVACDRDIELKIFRKNYDWKMPVIRDTGTLRKQLGVPENTRITLLNSKGKVLAHITDEDFLSGGQCERLLQILKQ